MTLEATGDSWVEILCGDFAISEAGNLLGVGWKGASSHAKAAAAPCSFTSSVLLVWLVGVNCG